jgi:hypothetical protein
MTLVSGVASWFFAADNNDPGEVGPYGVIYGLVTLAIIVISLLLLLLRYRKVAR